MYYATIIVFKGIILIKKTLACHQLFDFWHLNKHHDDSIKDILRDSYQEKKKDFGFNRLLEFSNLMGGLKMGVLRGGVESFDFFIACTLTWNSDRQCSFDTVDSYFLFKIISASFQQNSFSTYSESIIHFKTVYNQLIQEPDIINELTNRIIFQTQMLYQGLSQDDTDEALRQQLTSRLSTHSMWFYSKSDNRNNELVIANHLKILRENWARGAFLDTLFEELDSFDDRYHIKSILKQRLKSSPLQVSYKAAGKLDDCVDIHYDLLIKRRLRHLIFRCSDQAIEDDVHWAICDAKHAGRSPQYFGLDTFESVFNHAYQFLKHRDDIDDPFSPLMIAKTLIENVYQPLESNKVLNDFNLAVREWGQQVITHLSSLNDDSEKVPLLKKIVAAQCKTWDLIMVALHALEQAESANHFSTIQKSLDPLSIPVLDLFNTYSNQFPSCDALTGPQGMDHEMWKMAKNIIEPMAFGHSLDTSYGFFHESLFIGYVSSDDSTAETLRDVLLHLRPQCHIYQ